MHPYDFVFLLLCAGVIAAVALRQGHRRLFAFGLIASLVITAVVAATVGLNPEAPGANALFLILYYGLPWTVGVGLGLLAREAFARWLEWRRDLP